MHRIILPLAIAVIASCDPPSEEFVIGDWRLSSNECAGQAVVQADLEQLLWINSGSAATQITTGAGANQCVSMVSGMPTDRSTSRVRIQEDAAANIQCEPLPCEHELAGETVRCPMDLPFSGFRDILSADENEMVTNFNGCDQVWQRE